MASLEISALVHGLTDGQDRLVEADELLTQLQLRCGGSVPGVLAVPELLELVRHSRLKSLRLAREFHSFDGNENVTGFVRIAPERGDGETGCELTIENWRQEEPAQDSEADLSQLVDEVDQSVADLTARLDPELRVLSAFAKSPDLADCAQAMADKPRAHWSDFIQLTEADYRQPLHWRLIDGARAKVEGSQRDWRIRLLPSGLSTEAPDGFELLLVSQQPWLVAPEHEGGEQGDQSFVGAALTRVLRQPISRIISNAETIRARLAGPLREEYTNYAGDIASAGSHLLALLDDLADLEAVESDGFAIARERIDLAEIAARAVGILGAKANEKKIAITITPDAQEFVAIGEFRRVLQILINVVGNAINYAPRDSAIRIELARAASKIRVSVIDQGPGLDEEQQSRIFTKFERLGREGDGGSGLGLYISQRLAHAMRGELDVESAPGKGAAFTLSLPSA